MEGEEGAADDAVTTTSKEVESRERKEGDGTVGDDGAADDSGKAGEGEAMPAVPVPSEDMFVAYCLQKEPEARSSHDLKRLQVKLSVLDFFTRGRNSLGVEEVCRFARLQIFDEPYMVIFQEGDIGSKFFIILKGSVEIRKRQVNEAGEMRSTKLGELKTGAAFGEMALLSDSKKRNASIITKEPTLLITLRESDYKRCIKLNAKRDEPRAEASSAVSLLEASAGSGTGSRRFSKERYREILSKAPAARTAGELSELTRYFRSVKLFSRYSEEQRRALAAVIVYVYYWRRMAVFKQGAVGTHFYVIFSGTVDVHKSTDSERSRWLCALGEGDTFGELAVRKEGGRRAATVTTREFCELLMLNRLQYSRLVLPQQERHLDEKTDALMANATLAQTMTRDAVRQLAALMLERKHASDTIVCERGMLNQEVYFVKRGECFVYNRLRSAPPSSASPSASPSAASRPASTVDMFDLDSAARSRSPSPTAAAAAAVAAGATLSADEQGQAAAAATTTTVLPVASHATAAREGDGSDVYVPLGRIGRFSFFLDPSLFDSDAALRTVTLVCGTPAELLVLSRHDFFTRLPPRTRQLLQRQAVTRVEPQLVRAHLVKTELWGRYKRSLMRGVLQDIHTRRSHAAGVRQVKELALSLQHLEPTGSLKDTRTQPTLRDLDEESFVVQIRSTAPPGSIIARREEMERNRSLRRILAYNPDLPSGALSARPRSSRSTASSRLAKQQQKKKKMKRPLTAPLQVSTAAASDRPKTSAGRVSRRLASPRPVPQAELPRYLRSARASARRRRQMAERPKTSGGSRRPRRMDAHASQPVRPQTSAGLASKQQSARRLAMIRAGSAGSRRPSSSQGFRRRHVGAGMHSKTAARRRGARVHARRSGSPKSHSSLTSFSSHTGDGVMTIHGSGEASTATAAGSGGADVLTGMRSTPRRPSSTAAASRKASSASDHRRSSAGRRPSSLTTAEARRRSSALRRTSTDAADATASASASGGAGAGAAAGAAAAAVPPSPIAAKEKGGGRWRRRARPGAMKREFFKLTREAARDRVRSKVSRSPLPAGSRASALMMKRPTSGRYDHHGRRVREEPTVAATLENEWLRSFALSGRSADIDSASSIGRMSESTAGADAGAAAADGVDRDARWLRKLDRQLKGIVKTGSSGSKLAALTVTRSAVLDTTRR